jgi:hypothetical protein
MSSGYIVALELVANNAIGKWRALIGTHPTFSRQILAVIWCPVVLVLYSFCTYLTGSVLSYSLCCRPDRQLEGQSRGPEEPPRHVRH